MKGTTHVSARMTDEQIARVDALIPGMSTPWHRATRSDALRALYLAGLPIIEAEQRATRRAAKKARRS